MCVTFSKVLPYVHFPQSASDFVGMYIERAALTGYSPNIAITGAFDAVWSLGVALNITEGMRLGNETTDNCNASELAGELVPLDEFDYTNTLMGCVVRNNLQSLSFSGVTVSCS